MTQELCCLGNGASGGDGGGEVRQGTGEEHSCGHFQQITMSYTTTMMTTHIHTYIRTLIRDHNLYKMAESLLTKLDLVMYTKGGFIIIMTLASKY